MFVRHFEKRYSRHPLGTAHRTGARRCAMTAAAPLKWRTDFDKFVVTSNFDRRGWWRWDPDDGDDWNVFWANVHTVKQIFDPSNGIRLGEHQIVNHFPNHYELTRKDLMVKNMRRYRKELEKEARERGDDASCVPDFVPLTFSLPADYSLFVEEFRRVPHATWIVKPTGKAQGKGIFLINKLAQVKRWATGVNAPGAGARAPSQASREEAHVVSRYVADPLLVGGKKFDLRIYVVVTSYRPLRAYISRLGFARFCNVKYEDASDDLGNVYSRTSPSKNGARSTTPRTGTNGAWRICGCTWRARGDARRRTSCSRGSTTPSNTRYDRCRTSSSTTGGVSNSTDTTSWWTSP